MSVVHSLQASVNQSATQLKPTDGQPSVLGKIGATAANFVGQCRSNFVSNSLRICSGEFSKLPLIGAALTVFPQLASGCYTVCAGEAQPKLDCCDNQGGSYQSCTAADLASQSTNCLSQLLSPLNAINQTSYNAAIAYINAHSTTTAPAPAPAVSAVTTTSAPNSKNLTDDAIIAISMGVLAGAALIAFISACVCCVKKGREVTRLEGVVSTNAANIKRGFHELLEQIQQQIQQCIPAQLVELGALKQRCTTAINSLPDNGATEEQMRAANAEFVNIRGGLQALTQPTDAYIHVATSSV